MNKKQLFAYLADQESGRLLAFLEAAYGEMDIEQRHAVFGDALEKSEPLPVDGESLLAEVEEFRRESLAGEYYAPFGINSNNFMHVPEETNAWFERVGDLLTQSAQLSEEGDHVHAVACFRILYELIDAMAMGEEIVFADECGTWMITVDEKKMIAAYFRSLAATATPEEYAAGAIPLIRRDSLESFSKKTYAAAVRAGDKPQKAHLKAEVKRQAIRTQPRRRK